MSTGGEGPGSAAGAEGVADAAADLQRSALLRSVTHDLRAPLAAIRAIAADLRDGVAYDEATRHDLLQTVCDEVDRLDRLVGNLLTMSRLDAAALDPVLGAVDLAELVAHRLDALAPLLAGHEVVVDVPADLPLVTADFAQLAQVLTNLLANAARHAPAGTPLAVVARAEGDVVRLAVVDHGPGFPIDGRDELFGPFRRGAGSRSTGLGLAICRGIVAAHGGAIGVDDTPGGGATVWCTVPVHRPAEETGAAG